MLIVDDEDAEQRLSEFRSTYEPFVYLAGRLSIVNSPWLVAFLASAGQLAK